MTDVSWTIDTADFGTLTATGVLGQAHPTFNVGEETTVAFYFGTDVANHLTYYENLKEFGRYTNGATIDTGMDIRGKAWYREKLHPASSFSSVLVKLTPSSQIKSAEGYWALITDVEDRTRYPGAGEVVEASLFVLDLASEYASRTDVENDLKAEL